MPKADTPPPRTRGYKKKERTRAKLLDAAVETISAKGAAFTILDVVRAADVSNGTFYNYFPDRDALVDAITLHVLGEFTEVAALLVDVEDPAERFATISAMLLGQAMVNPQLATVTLRLEEMQPRAGSEDDPFHYLRLDLESGAASGRFANEVTDAMVDLIVGTLLRTVRRIVSEGVSNEHLVEVLMLLLQTLGLKAREARRIATAAIDRTNGGTP